METLYDSVAATLVKSRVISESFEQKLWNDIQSLKKIGWKPDKISKHLLQHASDYEGEQLSADRIERLYHSQEVNFGSGHTVKMDMRATKAPKAPKDIKYGMKDPKGKEKKDQAHAEDYFSAHGDADMDGSEALSLLTTAGYDPAVARKALHNLGRNSA